MDEIAMGGIVGHIALEKYHVVAAPSECGT
jgi:hypothetical protein